MPKFATLLSILFLGLAFALWLSAIRPWVNTLALVIAIIGVGGILIDIVHRQKQTKESPENSE